MAPQIKSIIQTGEVIANYPLTFNGNTLNTNLVTFKASIDPVANRGTVTITVSVSDLSEFTTVYQDLKGQLT